MTQNNKQAYWKDNLRLIGICLAIWFIVSYGFGILLVEPLNTISIGGYKLGFWFAQQGSIIAFLFIIVFYTVMMKKLDRKYKIKER